MALIPKTKRQRIAEGYTHYGKLWGIPVYIGNIESKAQRILTANFIPQWVLDVTDDICFTLLSYKTEIIQNMSPCTLFKYYYSTAK